MEGPRLAGGQTIKARRPTKVPSKKVSEFSFIWKAWTDLSTVSSSQTVTSHGAHGPATQVEQAAVANATERQRQQPASQENKGSLVIRAIRSVRSLAHVSAALQESANSESNTDVNTARQHSKLLPQRTQLAKDPKGKKPSLPARHPGESTSSWEVGALSSPERENSPGVLAPPVNHRRLVNRKPVSSIASADKRGGSTAFSSTSDNKAPMRAEKPCRSPLPTEQAPEKTTGIGSALPRPPVIHKRHSILSVTSTDEMSGTELSSIEKQNRRSSTGSSIRWDGDAMAQLAKQIREERKQLRAQRERERAQMGGATVHIRENKRDKSLARRRTPLSEVFDLNSCAESPPMATSPVPLTSLPSVDPIAAATEALLGITTASHIENVPQARPRNKPVSSRPRPVGIVVVEGDHNDSACLLQTPFHQTR